MLYCSATDLKIVVGLHLQKVLLFQNYWDFHLSQVAIYTFTIETHKPDNDLILKFKHGYVTLPSDL